MKSFKYSGLWWLPTMQDHKVSGTVEFIENDRINLSLDGLLEPMQDSGLLNPLPFKKHSLILGLTDDGLAVTLFDCFDTNLTISSEGNNKQRCLAHVAYLGTHFAEPQEIRFDKLDVYYSYLPQWAGVFPFRGLQASFTEVRASTTKGTITVQPMVRLGEELIDESNLAEAVCIRIETQETLSPEEWNVRFISPLQNFLSLATQRANALVNLRAYIRHSSVPQTNASVSEIPVQIIYPPAFMPVASSRTVFPNTILFSLQDIAPDFSNIMESWLRIAEELDSVCILLFPVVYTARYLDQRFLFTAQAAEVYQSRRTEKRYLSEDEYKELLEEILAGCPENHREWLDEKLRYANKPTFRQQLKALVNKTIEIMQPLIGSRGRDKVAFIEAVYDTRNYLTHHTKELEAQAAGGDILFSITQCLYIIMQVCLLYELGFTSQRCAEMFSKHESYQFLLGRQPFSS